jgi:hypothetical protein
MIEFRKTKKQLREKKIPRRLRKKRRKDIMLEEDSVEEGGVNEHKSGHYDVNYSQVWPDSPNAIINETVAADKLQSRYKILQGRKMNKLKMISQRKHRIIKRSVILDEDLSEFQNLVENRMRRA